MNSSIGILTFHNANNYGAVLQSYALSTTISKLHPDWSVKFLNYDSPSMPLRAAQSEVFSNFCTKHLSITDPLDSAEALSNYLIHNNYTAVVTGSDQVWNLNLTGGDTKYYLDFVPKGINKYSYAASIGANVLDNTMQATIPALVSSFDKISLREESHVNFIQNCAPCKVTSHLDPTLLLTADEYTKEFQLTATSEKYILLFYFQGDPFLIDLANLLSAKYKLKLIAISGYDNCMFINGSLTPGNITPEHWLEYIQNASLVLTDSFHCTSFSIIFHKPFYTYTGGTGNSVRLLNILEKLQLLNRNLISIKDINAIDFTCDYTAAECILTVERKKAFDYLKSFC